MSCPMGSCNVQSASMGVPDTNLTLTVNDTFSMTGCFSIKPPSEWQECIDCAAEVTAQVKLSTDTVWLTIDPTTALSTGDLNPDFIYSTYCDTCDFALVLTVKAEAAAAGFTWNIRIKAGDCVSASKNVTVNAAAAATAPTRMTLGVGT